MENVWGSVETSRKNALSSEGEYLKAEIIEDGGNGGSERHHDMRAVWATAVFLVGVYIVSMVGGYVGSGAFYSTSEAIDSFIAQLAGGLAHDATVAPMVGGVPAGSTAITADGLRVRCAGSLTKPGKGRGGESTVVVAIEVQNIGDDKVVLRRSNIAGIGADGEVIEPLDQRLSRGDSEAFYQFTSVAAEPGECLTVCSSFR